ncbi:hypothetical protein QR680_010359 [Steinernema hermaphroditum]|uniref:Uncharacterized protein n=1 Tax=Steinernema hermaphroditum TaxID=289476 RepID=A0AA39IR62_9BILA|nr:hypothetical protein QR680_010359 [Steinernema hermaphroditum]
MSRSRDYQLDLNKLLGDARSIMEQIQANRDRQAANLKESKGVTTPRFCKPDRVKKFDPDLEETFARLKRSAHWRIDSGIPVDEAATREPVGGYPSTDGEPDLKKPRVVKNPKKKL